MAQSWPWDSQIAVTKMCKQSADDLHVRKYTQYCGYSNKTFVMSRLFIFERSDRKTETWIEIPNKSLLNPLTQSIVGDIFPHSSCGNLWIRHYVPHLQEQRFFRLVLTKCLLLLHSKIEDLNAHEKLYLQIEFLVLLRHRMYISTSCHQISKCSGKHHPTHHRHTHIYAYTFTSTFRKTNTRTLSTI